MYTINQWSNSVLRNVTNQTHDIFSYNETSTIPFHSTSYVRSKPTIHILQQQASLPGASWRGMVPSINSAVSSPGTSWKVTVPMIISANSIAPPIEMQQGITNMYNIYT